MWKVVKIWWRANFMDYSYWRVTFPPDIKRSGAQFETRLLGYDEAWNLKEIYGGDLWIDYSVELK